MYFIPEDTPIQCSTALYRPTEGYMGNLSNRDSNRHIDRMAVPEVVINRLPQYVRVLKSLISDEIQVVNSQLLGKKLQITPTQIRKDLSYFLIIQNLRCLKFSLINE